MPASNDRIYLEVEKAKEVMRAATNLFRAGGSISKAINDAEDIASIAFRHVDQIVIEQDTSK